ncbi:MAG: hypothetical protein RR075_06030, partial [Pygmaiobacter sp.]
MNSNSIVKKEKKEFRMINSFGLLFLIIVFVALLTYVIPAGSFERVEGTTGRMEVIPGSYQQIEKTPAHPFDVFMALPEGIISTAGMVVCTLMIGGGMEVVTKTGALNIGISKAIVRLNKKSGELVLAFLFLIFSALGGFMGFGEAAIPFFPIAVAISVALGYDSMVGVGIALVGCMMGFIAGPTNQSNVGIPQALAGLPLYSGIGLRIVLFVVLVAVGLHHVLAYAKKTKKNPEKSLMKGVDVSDLAFDIESLNKEKFTVAHGAILTILVGGMVFFTYMAMTTDWWLNQLSAMFVLIGIAAGLIGRLKINDICESFLKGIAEISGGAMIIGVAAGIQYIIGKANIMDTIINAISTPLAKMPLLVSAIGMLIVISLINILIPSGSGKAVAIMPILFPIASLLGFTQQTAVLAYQLG